MEASNLEKDTSEEKTEVCLSAKVRFYKHYLMSYLFIVYLGDQSFGKTRIPKEP